MFQRTCSLSRAFLLFVVSAGCTYMCSSVINSAFNAIVTVANVRYWDHFLLTEFLLWKIILPWTRSFPFGHRLLALYFIFSYVYVYVVFSCLCKKTGTGLKREKASLNCKRDLAMEYLLVLYLNYPLFENANLHEFILFIC